MSSVPTPIEKSAIASAPLRKPPEIDPRWVKRQTEGFCFNEFVVRMPIDATLDDLKRPEIWRLVQIARGASMRKFDRVRIISYDETWIAEAIIAAATADGLTLSKPTVTQLPPRTEFLPEDDSYRVIWVGNGYRTQRKKDGNHVTQIVQTKQEAERDMSALYGRPAA